MVGKLQVFQNFFQIENLLNIKKVMSKNVMSPCSIFRGARHHFMLNIERSVCPFRHSIECIYIVYII